LLSLFKNRPYLKDLIPDNHTDIHSHLLPGIDDGAKSIEDTVFLVTELTKIGMSRFITTPHVMNNVWNNTKPGIEAKLQQTVGELKAKNVNYTINAAAEYLLEDNFVKLFQSEKLLTLKDEYVLVEMSYINPPIQLYQILFELQLEGYKPILAHPERYGFYHNNFEEYNKLRNAGCLFQLNLLSTVGYYGLAAAKVAETLLKKGLIDFTGSDVHHQNHIKAFSKKIIIKESAALKAALKNNQLFDF
jgi:protein-tyrosine phosphatase